MPATDVSLNVDPVRLTELVARIFASVGVSTEDARTVADCLVLADLRGVGSHGVSRMPIYLERLRKGLVNAAPTLAVHEIAAACAKIDGDNGLGFLVAKKAMAEACARAGSYGVGVVAAHNSTHFGMAATYLIDAAEAGYVSFVFTNASPAMPIWGGRKPFLGTSPFAFGAPGGDGTPPVILDMATSVVARGKIRRAAQKGEPIPAGWALDADGNETTDAQKAYEGIIQPLGGPKGSGLSLMMEVVAGVMSGSAFGGEVGNQYADFDRPQDVGHMFVALKPDLFLGEGDYRTRMGALVSRAKGQPRLHEDQPILMPGEPESIREAERRRSGLPISVEDITMLENEASRAGVAFVADDLALRSAA
ncbi:lactate dehydrogenase [Rhizobium albus]|nr:lactate dehydrogenase [Rhizobium albus]